MPHRDHWCWRCGPGALYFLFLLVIAPTIRGAAVATALDIANFTIDDASSGDEFHSAPSTTSNMPPGSTDYTIASWSNQACTGCLNMADTSRVHGGTYTALYLPSDNNFTYDLSFQFNGSAIYVYLVLSNQAGTACDFILDNDSVRYAGSTMDSYQYEVLAFSRVGLELKMHDLTIRAGGGPDTANYLNFDYANYTRHRLRSLASTTDPTDPAESNTPSATPTHPPNNHLTAKSIAGGVVGGFIAVVAIIFAAAFYKRKQKRRRLKPEEDIRPFPTPISSGTENSEYHGLMSMSTPQSLPHHRSRDAHPPLLNMGYNYDPNRIELLRQQRQQELNRRLESMRQNIRDLKATYTLEQQMAREHGRVYGDDGGHPPAFLIVPGGMGSHRDDSELTDMKEQMRIMMDQIQYLQAQQTSSYAQGLTDEPPPGYMQVLNSSRHRS